MRISDQRASLMHASHARAHTTLLHLSRSGAPSIFTQALTNHYHDRRLSRESVRDTQLVFQLKVRTKC